MADNLTVGSPGAGQAKPASAKDAVDPEKHKLEQLRELAKKRTGRELTDAQLGEIVNRHKARNAERARVEESRTGFEEARSREGREAPQTRTERALASSDVRSVKDGLTAEDRKQITSDPNASPRLPPSDAKPTTPEQAQKLLASITSFLLNGDTPFDAQAYAKTLTKLPPSQPKSEGAPVREGAQARPGTQAQPGAQTREGAQARPGTQAQPGAQTREGAQARPGTQAPSAASPPRTQSAAAGQTTPARTETSQPPGAGQARTAQMPPSTPPAPPGRTAQPQSATPPQGTPLRDAPRPAAGRAAGPQPMAMSPSASGARPAGPSLSLGAKSAAQSRPLSETFFNAGGGLGSTTSFDAMHFNWDGFFALFTMKSEESMQLWRKAMKQLRYLAAQTQMAGHELAIELLKMRNQFEKIQAGFALGTHLDQAAKKFSIGTVQGMLGQQPAQAAKTDQQLQQLAALSDAEIRAAGGDVDAALGNRMQRFNSYQTQKSAFEQLWADPKPDDPAWRANVANSEQLMNDAKSQLDRPGEASSLTPEERAHYAERREAVRSRLAEQRRKQGGLAGEIGYLRGEAARLRERGDTAGAERLELSAMQMQHELTTESTRLGPEFWLNPDQAMPTVLGDRRKLLGAAQNARQEAASAERALLRMQSVQGEGKPTQEQIDAQAARVNAARDEERRALYSLQALDTTIQTRRPLTGRTKEVFDEQYRKSLEELEAAKSAQQQMPETVGAEERQAVDQRLQQATRKHNYLIGFLPPTDRERIAAQARQESAALEQGSEVRTRTPKARKAGLSDREAIILGTQGTSQAERAYSDLRARLETAPAEERDSIRAQMAQADTAALWESANRGGIYAETNDDLQASKLMQAVHKYVGGAVHVLAYAGNQISAGMSGIAEAQVQGSMGMAEKHRAELNAMMREGVSQAQGMVNQLMQLLGMSRSQ